MQNIENEVFKFDHFINDYSILVAKNSFAIS